MTIASFNWMARANPVVQKLRPPRKSRYWPRTCSDERHYAYTGTFRNKLRRVGSVVSVEFVSDRSSSNYDECAEHLLRAFFNLPGQSDDDERLRRRIEDTLTDLAEIQRRCAIGQAQFSAKVFELKRS
ncbi:MAG: hypothetical protein ACTHP8_20850 [Bosea sp. (in: a-proteobacteria)]|uniref:hypothetical protein n=1 Tax=Bosea sp. (in: a-proteobacteria) TaxID=1871050 RepID=UPI003F7BF210